MLKRQQELEHELAKARAECQSLRAKESSTIEEMQRSKAAHEARLLSVVRDKERELASAQLSIHKCM